MSLDKAALITGATGGIGLAIAKKMTALADTIILTGRSSQKLAEAKQKIKGASNTNVIIYETNLENEVSILKLVDFINQKKIDLSYLIHSAGSIKTGPFLDTCTQDFDVMVNVNARAPYILSRSLLPNLSKNKGQIVFINSSAVHHSYTDRGLYAFSKIVLKGIADVLRQELNEHEIKVLSIFPGQTATSMQQKLYDDSNKTYLPEFLIQPDDVAETVYDTLTLASTIEVTDVFMRPMKKNPKN